MTHAQGTTPLTTRSATRSSTSSSASSPRSSRTIAPGGWRCTARNGGPAFLSGVDLLLRHQRHPRSATTSSTSRFTPTVMTLYQGWQSYIEDGRHPDPERRDRGVAVARRADRARRGALQQQADRDHRRQGPQRRPAPAGHPGHLHDLPQHAQRRRSLGAAAARHRPHRSRAGARPTCRSTRCATRPPARPSRPPTRAGRSSPANGTTSAASRGRRCAPWRRARRTSTTASPRT